jgi:hypothetical protein
MTHTRRDSMVYISPRESDVRVSGFSRENSSVLPTPDFRFPDERNQRFDLP